MGSVLDQFKIKYEQEKNYVDGFRSLIDRETRLRNNRLTWMLASQSILFLAFSNLFKGEKYLPSLIISILGLLTNFSFSIGLKLCQNAINYYREKVKKRLGTQLDQYPDLDYNAKSDPSSSVYLPWAPWNILPWLFWIAWLLLSVIILCKFLYIEEHFVTLLCP